MFQHINKLILSALIIVLALSLKPSEVGANDWAINTLGQLRDIIFTKNKIYFLSHLNSIGILDKYTGNMEARAVVAESEKVVGFGELTMNVVTRYNQVVSYFVTSTGLDKRASNYKLENKTVQWITRFDQNEYFITKSSFHHGKEVIKQAQADQTFLRIVQGTTVAGKIIYLLSKNTKANTYCIQNNLKGSLNKYCFEASSQEILEFQFYQGHLILSLNSSTLLLSQSLQLITKFNQKLVQLTNGALVLPSKCYNIEERRFLQKRPVKSFKKDTEISLIQNNQGIVVYRDNIELFSIKEHRNNSVVRTWFNFKSQMDYDIVIQFSDLELVCYSISRGDVQVGWKKEESLAYIQDVVFMKYHQIDTLDNQYHRNLILHSYRSLSMLDKISQVPKDLLLRLKQELSDIQHFIFQSVNYLLIHLSDFDSTSIRKFQMSPEQQIKHGLRKYLIAATQYNTLIAIDTKSHQILWKINRNTDNRFIKFVHLKRDYETEVAVIISYSQAASQTIIEEITQKGEIKYLQTYNSQHQPYIYKLNYHNIALKLGQKIQKFCLFKQDDLPEKQFYFYTQEKNDINGWKVVGNAVVQIWNFQTKGSEQIIKITSAFRGDQTATIPMFDSQKVFFKNVDFTNLAVLTSFNRTDVALYIINGRTGKVQFNSYKNSISLNLPINIVYDQNNVLVSYFNHKSKNFQIWTVEQYQEKIETSALSMITEYMKGNNYRPQESREKTIFEDQVYGSPIYIKHMYVSQSKMSLTKRNLFIITRQNKLYTVNRDFVSTRRPKKDTNSYFANQKFPQYSYFLPYTPSSFLSYYLELSTLNKIQFSPTDMESTIFTLCYGTDLFLIRNAPDKAFDMITEDFNHVVLILILIAATVAILTFKKLLNSAKLKKPHLE